MPRISFTPSALNGAAPGIAQALASAFGGGRAQQNAYDQTMTTQSRIAQAIAQTRAAEAAARANDAKAGQIGAQRQVLEGRPGLFEEQVAASSGTDIPIVQAIRNSIRTGQAPAIELPGPTMDGSPLQGPIDPATRSKVAQALQQFMPLLSNTGDLKPDDLAKAASTYREMGLSDRIIAGQADRNTVGGAQAAVGAKPLYNQNTDGAVLDLFAGNLDTANPMAQSTIGLRNSQSEQAKAGAVENLAQGRAADASAGAHVASAEASRAMAALRRTQAGNVGQGGSGGGGKAPAHYRWTTDLETGEPKLEPIPGGKADPSATPAKPMPAAVLKMQQEELDAIGAGSSLNADLGAFVQQIESGKLQLGPVNNLLGQVKNFAGISDENSRNLASFQATLERLRNESLRLNKGVQTEGDAQRAWNELVRSINDPKVVAQRLADIQAINQRAVGLRQMNIDTIRGNYGLPPLDTSGRVNVPPAINPGAAPKPPAAAPARTVAPDTQKARDRDRASILMREYETAKGPADIQAIGRELQRMGIKVPAAAAPQAASKTVTRTGTAPDGRKVVQYSDGTIEYAN